MFSIVVLLALLTASALYFVGIYRGLAARRAHIESAWTDIDGLLRQRDEELRKLIDVGRCHLRFEQETFEKILRAGESIAQASTAGNIAGVGAGERQLQGGMQRLLGVAASCPQLQADQSYQQLRTRIMALEESIAERRELYNERVNLNNIRSDALPDSVIAACCGFEPAPLLE